MQSQLSDAQIEFAHERWIRKGLELSIDPDLIEQVLINLIRNAIQSMACQPVRRLEQFWPGSMRQDTYWMEVSDNGPGIPRDIQQRIFIRFLRRPKRMDQGSA